MAIYWPAGLPLGIKYGADTELGKGAKISSDMDYGNKKRRQRFTNVAARQTVQIKFNDAQYEQFAYFYELTLLNGVVSFYAPVVTPSGIESRRCTIDDDSLQVVHESYNYHTVGFTLEIYNLIGVVIGDDGYAWLIGFYGEDFIVNGLADPLQYVVNVQYPEAVEPY